jgi:hypothetical protein
MTQKILEARAALDRAMEHPNNLVLCHAQLAQGPGRRWKEISLNHAAVFLTVSAWQTYVEETANAVLDALRPQPPGSPLLTASFSLVTAQHKLAISNFNTPNASNTKKLFGGLGFEPRPSWTWRERGLMRTTESVEGEINSWLDVRHKIAHGDELPKTSVVTGLANGVPRLRLADAKRCRRFFLRLADVTTADAHTKFP